MFGNLGVHIISGHCFLGGYLADNSGWLDYVSEKVNVWVSHLLSLTKVADKKSQVKYTALNNSLQHEKTFLQRCL